MSVKASRRAGSSNGTTTRAASKLDEALDTVRRTCLLCGEFIFKNGDTSRCDVSTCNLHPYRKGSLPRGKKATPASIRAIAVKHCRECSGANFREDCPHAKKCPLYALVCGGN